MSENPAYLASNLIDADTVITSSTEDANWTRENLYEERQAVVFRFTSPIGGYIEFDLLSARDFDTIAILNLPQASSITVKVGNSPNPSTVVSSPSWQRGGVWAALGSLTYRYVRVTVVFITTNYPQIGQIRLGQRTPILPYSFHYDYEAGTEEDNIERKTVRGVEFTYNLSSQGILNTDWRVGRPQLELLRTMHFELGGRSRRFLFIPDTSQPELIYGKKQAGFRYRRVPAASELYDYSMPITGDSFGADILA